MKKQVTTILSVLIIIVLIVYIVADMSHPSGIVKKEAVKTENQSIPDAWKITKELKITEGTLKTVTVSPKGKLFLGGDSFISGYDLDLKQLWSTKTSLPVTALTIFGDTLFAATYNHILVLNLSGKILCEWGPFEDSCMITSVSANKLYLAVADAGNKMVMILDKGGEVKKIIGQNDKQFIIPSPFFDVALDKDNTLYVANTGHHRIEIRRIDGTVIGYFGKPGKDPSFFCGCCAPPHFALIPQGFVTAEKGINRIKILNKTGDFVEFVNSKNNFIKSVPLDLASADGITIYGAYPGDSKLFVFNRE